jgi:hypothetical protein
MFKEELDGLLPPEATTIVMDTNNDKEDRYKKYHRSVMRKQRFWTSSVTRAIL